MKDKPLPSKYNYNKINYNKSLLVEIDKNSNKIFIDNKYDLNRRNQIVNFLAQKLFNKKINLFNNPRMFDKKSHVFWAHGGYVKLNTPYSHQIDFIDIFSPHKVLIKEQQLNLVKNGIVIENFSNRTLITSLYANLHYLHNIKGLSKLLKLDTEALERKVAHFTDEYLKKYSLKEPLEQELKKQGFIIVNNIDEADIIISTENLAYHKIHTLVREINYPKSYDLTYTDLFKEINTDKYYRDSVQLLDINTIASHVTNILEYFPKSNSNPVLTTNTSLATFSIIASSHRLKDGPFSTINSLTIFKHKKKLGRIIDLTVLKGFSDKKIYTKTSSYKYNEVLSDKLIDDLNKQAAKQVLSKIKFVEAKK